MREETVRLTAATAFLLAAAVPDIKTKKIPFWIPAVALPASLAADLLCPSCMTKRELLSGMVPGAGLLMLSCVTGGEVGEGDGICLLICGLLTGLTQTLVIAETALFLAAIVGAVCIWTKRRKAKDRIAFMPFLAAAAAAMLTVRWFQAAQ